MVRFKLPNSAAVAAAMPVPFEERQPLGERVMTFSSELAGAADRKSTRLNSSHSQISYAVFCLKRKNWHNAALAPVRSRRSGFACLLSYVTNRPSVLRL